MIIKSFTASENQAITRVVNMDVLPLSLKSLPSLLWIRRQVINSDFLDNLYSADKTLAK